MMQWGLDKTPTKLSAHHDFGWPTISSQLDCDSAAVGGTPALR
jgi:hypothetical protein